MMNAPLHLFTKLASLLLATLAIPTAAEAQCASSWRHPNLGPMGILGRVDATAQWDPDGAGPSPTLVVLGGQFLQAGGLDFQNLVLWDPQAQAFSALGAGPDGPVHALAVDAAGQLVVGGEFASIGGIAAPSIARWDGATWQPLGSGIIGSVMELITDSAGDLIAGGTISSAGGTPVNNIARWNGSAWSSMGSGLSGVDAEVRCFALLQNGDLAAGGVFTNAGGSTVRHMARWDGSSWSDLSTGLLFWNHTVDLATTPNGDLIATGNGVIFTVVRLSNGLWTAVANSGGRPSMLHATSSGRIFVSFPGLGQGPSLLEAVNGSLQSVATLPVGTGVVRTSVAYPGGGPDDFVFAGEFAGGSLGTYVGGVGTSGPLFLDRSVSRMEYGADGTLYASGYFSSIQGTGAMSVAMLNGSSWLGMGSGLASAAQDIAELPNGDIYAVTYTGVGELHRWDGTIWQQVLGAPGAPDAVLARADGSLLVGGYTLRLFDGSTWGVVPMLTAVDRLHQLPNGDVVCWSYTAVLFSGEKFAIWDGVNVQALPDPFGGAFLDVNLATTPQGQLLALARSNSVSNPLAYWDGSAWQVVTDIPGTISQLADQPNGEVLLAGEFTFGTPGKPTTLARWDGQTFTPIDGAPLPPLTEIAVAPNGTIAVAWGGDAPVISFLENACAADRADLGPGCASSGGDNVLLSRWWPVTGGTYVADGSGLPQICLVADIMGTATANLPLDTLLPTGQPGCTLLVDPLFLRGGATATGSYRSSLTVPLSGVLVGQVFHHQLVPIELDAAGDLATVTASNAMTLTIGAIE